MNIYMSGCTLPAKFDKKELIQKMTSCIERYMDLFIMDSNRINPVPGPKIKLMLDKFNVPFFVLELDATELGLRIANSKDYVEKTLVAITLNKEGTDLLTAGMMTASISKNKREIINIDVTNDKKIGSYQNLGIGKALILMFEDLAQEEQPNIDYTVLNAKMDKAGKNLKFYKKLGFYPVGATHNNLLPMAKGIQRKKPDDIQDNMSDYFRLKTVAEFHDRLSHLSLSQKMFWNGIVRRLQRHADAKFKNRTTMLYYEHCFRPNIVRKL